MKLEAPPATETHRKNKESAGWNHKDFMKEVTFSLRHEVSQV